MFWGVWTGAKTTGGLVARGECATKVGVVKADPRRPVFVAARSVVRVAVGISGFALPESIHGRQNPIYR